MKLKNQVIEITLNESKSNQICEFCMINRQKRNINKTSRIRIIKFLKIVHSDLKKSMLRTQEDFAYYMIFRGNWSIVIWMHLRRKKNQVFDIFKTFQTNIERFSDAKIIILRIDNEDEYINQNFQKHLTENKINWNSRVLYVSKQNDETKRLNRIFMYKIRSMLNQTKISRDMWDEIIKTIAYLSNWSSYYQLNNKASYEMIKSK